MGLVWSKAVEGEKMEPTRFVEVIVIMVMMMIITMLTKDDDGGDGDIDDVSSNDNLDRMLNHMFVSSQYDLEG